MIFYLSPRDVGFGIGFYASGSYPILRVADGLPAAIATYITIPPTRIELQLPFVLGTRQALGYQSFAAISSLLQQPHQWRIEYLLFENSENKYLLQSFTNIFSELNYATTIPPVSVWVIFRDPQRDSYVHLISPIAVLSNTIFQQPSQGGATLNITLSAPSTSVFSADTPQFPVLTVTSLNDPLLLSRAAILVSVEATTGSKITFTSPEVMGFNINIQANVNWTRTTKFDVNDLLVARSPFTYSVSPFQITGEMTTGIAAAVSTPSQFTPDTLYNTSITYYTQGNPNMAFIQINLALLGATSIQHRLAANQQPNITIPFVASAISIA